jgi:hypothetical protein
MQTGRFPAAISLTADVAGSSLATSTYCWGLSPFRERDKAPSPAQRQRREPVPWSL